jgi:threonine/homoserine/homoserine lactone efflux protein
MKASFFMFFGYLTMMGVPVLLALLALNAALLNSAAVRTMLLVLIGAGCIVYGAVGIREVFIHGRRRRETADR